MSRLAKEGINVAATAVNTVNKAICAMAAGVRYLMPYTAYLDGINMDGAALVSQMRRLIDLSGSSVEIVSCVDTPDQFAASAVAGAHAVTIVPDGFWGDISARTHGGGGGEFPANLARPLRRSELGDRVSSVTLDVGNAGEERKGKRSGGNSSVSYQLSVVSCQ